MSSHTLDKDGFEPPRQSRWGKSQWKKWALGLALLLVVLALALGLGLGLGLPRPGSSEPSEPAPTSPPPCTNCTVPSLAMDTPWQIVLIETLSLDDENEKLVTPNPTTSEGNVTLYDIDMFLHQNLTVVQDLRAQGVSVICYFSAGSYEPERPDSSRFTDNDKGNELDGWPGEYWLDLNSANVRNIMAARIQIAAKMNCSGIDPDNVDGYDNDNGLDLTQDDSVSFVRFLANEAAQYGMMTGLKNAADIIDDVIDYVQFSVNEQCAQYGECDTFSGFPNAGKPVFHIEYPAGDGATDKTSFDDSDVSKYCNVEASGVDTADLSGFNTVLKYMNLSGFVQYCDSQTFVTDGF